MCVCVCRYLDNVVNKETAAAPIPHLHARLTSGEAAPAEMDIFSLIQSSYQVSALAPPTGSSLALTGCLLDALLFSQQRFGSLHSDAIEQMRFKQRLKVIQSLEDTAKRSVVGKQTNKQTNPEISCSNCVCVCFYAHV